MTALSHRDSISYGSINCGGTDNKGKQLEQQDKIYPAKMASFIVDVQATGDSVVTVQQSVEGSGRNGRVNSEQRAPGTDSAATLSTLLQVMAAFLVAGFGNVGAGLILDHVKEWPVFLHVNELFILVPSLLGLKGNLEMTMASRLSTQANLGHMDDVRELLKMAKGNLALVQCQATVVSFAVAIFASFVKSISVVPLDQEELSQVNGTTSFANQPVVQRQMNGVDWDNALILCASSLLTANVACFVLGTMMILVIVGSHKVRIDPDNIAAPMASSLGDMTTAALLAVIAHSIYHYSENQQMPYLALVITMLFLGMLPIWICVARANPYTSNVISKGWTPIVVAVFISSCGGFILEYGKSRFSRMPVFQPVINGVGGNLVAVQASRLSTSLHRQGKVGQLPAKFKLLTGPVEIFFSGKADINFTTARLLLIMSLPAHLLYFFVIYFIVIDNTAPVTMIFLGLYTFLAVLQVAILLYMAQNLVNLLWRCSIDPDNYSTPLLTATGDLLGGAFLLVVFIIAYQLNDPYALTTV